MDRSNDIVIVALPSEHDYVRQISSEKEPHLTLLYLGKNNFNETELMLATKYVEFASSMLHRFSLEVESRGELGDKSADVLFFNTEWSQNLTAFRENLLRYDPIEQAYLSVDQFPWWVPHLTLGYPETPAKKENSIDPRFFSVEFDRIALWTGDSTGPTFPLKQYSYQPEVAMSQTDHGRYLAAGEQALAHYGVKGMKWGRRKADDSSASADHQQVKDYRKRIKAGGTKTLSNAELKAVVERMNLEKQYKEKKPKTVMDEGKKFAQDFVKEFGKEEAKKAIRGLIANQIAGALKK